MAPEGAVPPQWNGTSYLPRAEPSTRPGGVSRSQAEPWQPRAERPGGWFNPHARKGVSTFGNTGKRRPADWYLPKFESLAIFTEILRSAQDDSGRRGSPIPIPIPAAPTGRALINFLKVNIFRHL